MKYLNILLEFLLPLLTNAFLSEHFFELFLIVYLYPPALVEIFELIYWYLLNLLNLSALENMFYQVFDRVQK